MANQQVEDLKKELQADMDAWPKPSLDPARALGEGALSIIPGGQAAEAKLLGALPGTTTQQVAQKQQQVRKDNPVQTAAGQVGAGAAVAPLMPEVAGGALAKAGASVAQTVAMQPIYKLGDVMSQAQALGDPLRVEQIMHALIPDVDTLWAAGLTAVAHIPGLAVAGVQNVRKTLGGRAAAEAGDLLPRAARELDLSKEEAGQLALRSGILKEQRNADHLASVAGKTMGKIGASTPVTQGVQDRLALELERIVKETGADASAASTLKAMQEQSAAWSDVPQNGDQIETTIQNMHKRPGDSRLWGEAKQRLRGIWADHIETTTGRGNEYKDAVANYRTFINMADEAAAGANRQGTVKNLILNSASRASTAVGAAAGAAVGGGPMGAAAGAAVGYASKAALDAAGKTSPGGKNYALLLDRFNKNPPYATFLKNSQETLKSLTETAPIQAARSQGKERNIDKYYDDIAGQCRQVAANPESFAQQLGQRLSFLPPHEADPIVAHVTNRMVETAAQLPQPNQPPTLFGVQTGPTDRQKRDLLNKFEAKFNPWKAIMSGNAEIIAEADRHWPETMQQLRRQVIAKCADPKTPYSTQRKISAILGAAGVPTQDPALAAQLQQCLQNSRQAQSNQGQMDSARQSLATQKNAKATMSRAQNLAGALNDGK